jgi:hypothetical protein
MNIILFNLEYDTTWIDLIKQMPIKNKGSYAISFNDTPTHNDIPIAKNCKYIDIDLNIQNQISNSIKKNQIHNIQYINCIGYPPNGGMDWHTNSDNPGIRIYASWSENGNSGMIWYKNNEIIFDQDRIGLNIRQFTTPCWHKVWSKCYRLSIGYKI